MPAITDLIVGMGARDRLVAVSSYDRGRADVASLPVIGNYDTFDWERLADLRPTVLVTFIAPDRQPAGTRDRAAELGIRLVNLPINKLDDLGPTVEQLGTLLDEPALARSAWQQMKARLDAVKARAAGRPTVAALVVGRDPTQVAGPGSYVDDLLTLAGGTNVAAGLHRDWPTVDREQLAAFRPDVVIQLIPGATGAEADAARAAWPAGQRVCVLTGPYVEQPGFHLPELAEQFARCLHPTTRP